MEDLMLLVRYGVASVILALGMSKLVPNGISKHGWIPGGLEGIWVRLIQLIAVGEIVIAFTVGLRLLGPRWTAICLLTAAVFLTAYGVISVLKTGHCGCSSSPSTETTVARLMLRNISLFGVGVGSVWFGPESLGATGHAAEAVLLVMSFAPIAILIAFALRNALISRWSERHIQTTHIHS